MSKPRVAIAGIKHETNTFSTVKTKLEDYSPRYGQEIIDFYDGTRTEIGGFIDVLRRKGAEIVPTISAYATPSGPINREDFEYMIERVLQGIGEAGKVDGVLLALHGAMVAEGIPEAEGTLLKAVRELVGEHTPVIITLDLHALVSLTMVDHCDAVFGFDTNPHTDMYERGVEASETMAATLEGKIRPMVAFKKVGMMPPTINQRTTEGPMTKLQARAFEMEEDPKVLNACLFPAFPYADVERVGSAAVVVTDGDPTLAQNLADELGGMFWSLREEFLKPLTPIPEAVRRAIEAPEGPIILADVADNPGGGAPGDGTEILRELIRQGAKNVGVAIIKDPEAVQRAAETGVRGSLTMEIGGKTDGFHGDPLEITGTVRTLTDGYFIHKAGGVGVKANVGKTAVIDVDGIEIILTERSHAPNDPEIYRRNGIEPTDKKILVLKSRGHFRAAYEPFSKEVIEVDAPGLTTPNLSWFTYTRVPRPLWPLDEN
jgi:microcystin degradation protein MlrC